MFIGFTGTPLLKADKQTSIEMFGGYIHTYKFDEAVRGRGRARPALRGARHRPAPHLAGQDRPVVRGQDQGHDRPGQGASSRSAGARCRRCVSSSRALDRSSTTSSSTWRPSRRLMNGRGNAMLVGVEHLPGLQVLRAVLARPASRASAPSSPLRPACRRHLKGGHRRGRNREAARSTTSTGRCWPTTSTSPPRQP